MFLRFFSFSAVCRGISAPCRRQAQNPVSRNQITISKPRGPRQNRKGHRKNENPVLHAAPLCARKGQPQFLNRNQPIFGGFPLFWSRGNLFSKSDVLLDAPNIAFYILHNIAHLTIQQGADGIYCFPRH